MKHDGKFTGVVAAGHPGTAEAAAEVLRAGGNAYDAVIAAHLAACVTEPILSSLGGGGFLLAQPGGGHPGGGRAVVYDFFVQTPMQKRPESETNFFPITADFGTVQQVFHTGYGSIATPGTVSGLFAIHRDLGRMPFKLLIQPALERLRSGEALNRFQARVLDIVQPIYLWEPETRRRFTKASKSGERIPLEEGDIPDLSGLSDLLEELAREGERFFYEGEPARKAVECCRSNGGHLLMDDFLAYRTVLREPLEVRYSGWRFLLNPPPGEGGRLTALALDMRQNPGDSAGRSSGSSGKSGFAGRSSGSSGKSGFAGRSSGSCGKSGFAGNNRGAVPGGQRSGLKGKGGNREPGRGGAGLGLEGVNFGQGSGVEGMVALQAAVERRRMDKTFGGRRSGGGGGWIDSERNFWLGDGDVGLFGNQNLEGRRYGVEMEVGDNPLATRGTTHISVADRFGNLASLSTSNGEGSGIMIPGSGVILNNMLGEEDLNPGGFGSWAVDRRMGSMMTPGIGSRADGSHVVFGSGGSNRIRTAILQVIVNLCDYGMSLEEAIDAPRVHFENGLLNMEPGFSEAERVRAGALCGDIRVWEEKSLFFGGVHAVEIKGSHGRGYGDARRGGAAVP